MLKKSVKIILSAAVLGYILFCLAVYVCPQWFFYHPASERSDPAAAIASGFPAQEVEYPAADGTKLYGWFVKPGAKQQVVVYFHGNAYNIEAFYHKLVPLVKAGYGAFIGEYRGFGGIEGDLRQENLAMDALAAVDYLHSLGYRNADLILYGMSMGSYAAVHTAFEQKNQPVAALILEVPFDSILNVVKQRIWPLFPFDWLVKDKYDNTENLARLNVPLLMMAAAKDKTVPVERAKELFRVANEPKELIIYPDAGHADLYDHNNDRDILIWLQNNEKIK